MTDKDPPNLTLLIKLMKLTASPNDAEALLAVRKANEQLLKFGGDWERLLVGKVTVIGDPFLSVPVPPRAAPDHRQATAPQRPQPRPMPPRQQPTQYDVADAVAMARAAAAPRVAAAGPYKRRRPPSKPTIDDVFNSL